jgi:hypothetical protein
MKDGILVDPLVFVFVVIKCGVISPQVALRAQVLGGSVFVVEAVADRADVS